MIDADTNEWIPVQQFEIDDLPVISCNRNVIFFHILLVSFPNTIVNLYWNPFICISINHLNFGPPGQTKFVFSTFTRITFSFTFSSSNRLWLKLRGGTIATDFSARNCMGLTRSHRGKGAENEF